MSPIITNISGASAFGYGFGAVLKPAVTGGILTSDATYYYRTFNANGTLGIGQAPLVADVLVVGGGGGSGTNAFNFSYGASGGGGGGGVSYESFSYSTFPLSPGQYGVTIGAGGPVTLGANNGSISRFGAVMAGVGGGGGGGFDSTNYYSARTGGSGGGGGGKGTSASGTFSSPGGATQGQGNVGGGGVGDNNASIGGSGGGRGSAAGNSTLVGTAFTQGATGTPISYFGREFAAGGRGGYFAVSGYTATRGTAYGAFANSGNGGFGQDGPNGTAGGSGTVIVRYLKSEVD